MRNKIGYIVRKADIKRSFSKGDTTNWSYKLYKTTETVKVTISKYKVYNLPERNKEAFLKKTKLTTKENVGVMRKTNTPYIKSEGCCSSVLIEINLLVKTEACAFISIETTPSKLKSDLIGWAAVKFF